MTGDSNIQQLTFLFHIFSEALDNQSDIRVVYCDIRKAFDRVWHTDLWLNYQELELLGTFCSGFKTVSDCQQCVVVNGQCS